MIQVVSFFLYKQISSSKTIFIKLMGCLILILKSGNIAEWLTHQTSNLRIPRCMGSNPVFFGQEILQSWLSTE